MRDRDVRNAARQMLMAEYAHDSNTRIIEEMGIWSGSVRIDIAVINGQLCGYELKSDSDNLSRLPVQADLYSQVFDKLILVVGAKHAEKAQSHIPEWWGIMVATQELERIDLCFLRAAGKNPSPNPYLVAQLLWRDEAIYILDSLGLAKGWRSKPVKALHERLANELPFDDLTLYVRESLKKRQNWLGQSVGNK